jgi:hypothetical protein
MKRSPRHVVVLALVAAFALLAAGASDAATHKPCKPKTAKKCKKPVVKKKPVPKPTPTPTPTPPPPAPNSSTTNIAAGVSAEDAATITAGVNVTRAYFGKIGVPADWRFDLYADSDHEAIVQDEIKLGQSEADARMIWTGGTTADAGKDHVVIWTAQPNGWTNNSSAWREKVVVHELFHTVQNFLSHNHAPNEEATWLREGSAEFIGFSAMADAGQGTFASYRDTMLSEMKAHSASVPLSVLEDQRQSQTNGFSAYSVGFFAVERLVAQKGVAALLDYWRQIGTGKSWQDAFAAAFGRATEQFYTEFEQYRTTL